MPAAIGLAAAVASGCALADLSPPAGRWGWIALAAASLIVLVTARRRRRVARAALVVALIALATAWAHLRGGAFDARDLAAWTDERPRLVRLEGIALAPPRRLEPAVGPFARFDHRPVASAFSLRTTALIGRDGARAAAGGHVTVVVDETIEPFGAGSRVKVIGRLSRGGAARNPGGFDLQARALHARRAGVLRVSSRGGVRVVEPAPGPSRVVRWRALLRERAAGWLAADLPGRDSDAGGRVHALLGALLLGRRPDGAGALFGAFRRVGLAHLLAISGLHLGLLVGFVLLVVRWRGTPRRRHGALVIVLVVVHLLAIDVRVPVLRAAVMTMFAALGLACGRRWRVEGLVALSGAALLLWRPAELWSPGFQLSYGVVLALLHLAPRVRRRWQRRRGRPVSAAQIAGAALLDALACATVAWMIATPIVLHHFAMLSPLAVPLSVLALPLVALLLVLGYAKIVAAAALPSASVLLAVPLVVCAEALLALVRSVDRLPGAVVHLPPPPAAWAIAAVAWSAWWGVGVRPRMRRAWLAAGVALGAWCVAPALPFWPGPALRVDMLAVGDGTCVVARSAGATMVFDAGSSSDPDAGENAIVPALRALGVRRIDLGVVSHANLDHYSAVLDLADELPLATVAVTPQFLRTARDEMGGPAAFLLDGLARRRVRVITAAAGLEMPLGAATLRWRHPPADEFPPSINDASMVVSVDAAGRRVLLTGDIEAPAIEALLARDGDLAADVLELPHHGSHHAAAEDLVHRVDPRVVLQSTAWWRWRRDAWDGALRSTERLVTARDGAVTVVIEKDGTIRTRARGAILRGPAPAPPRRARATDHRPHGGAASWAHEEQQRPQP